MLRKDAFYNSMVRFVNYFFQTITVHMTDEEMDNFVFAVLPKKTAAKMQKELQDLVMKEVQSLLCVKHLIRDLVVCW